MPEKIKAKENILNAIKDGKHINEQWLKELGFSQKDIDSKFGDLKEDGYILSQEKYNEMSKEPSNFEKLAKKGNAFFKDVSTLGKFAVENLIDGTPLNPTSLADDSLHVGKFKGFASDDDWLTTNEAILKMGTMNLETNVGFKDLQQWLKSNPSKAQSLQTILNKPIAASPVDLENITTPEGLYNYVMSHTQVSQGVSAVAATVLNQPSSGTDYHSSLTNQIMQIQATKNIAEAMNQIPDLWHKIAPVHEVTIPTMGGELSIGNNNGYLRIGDYTTKVPINEFRNYMQSHPKMAMSFSEILATSGFNNENVKTFFEENYGKADNRDVEYLIKNIQNYQGLMQHVTQPTQVSQVTQPIQSSQSTQPTQPTQSSQSTQPTQPTQSTNISQNPFLSSNITNTSSLMNNNTVSPVTANILYNSSNDNIQNSLQTQVQRLLDNNGEMQQPLKISDTIDNIERQVRFATSGTYDVMDYVEELQGRFDELNDKLGELQTPDNDDIRRIE